MKKLLALALAIAAVSGGSPVLAGGFYQPAPRKTVVVANVTISSVRENSVSNANTGMNRICGFTVMPEIETGKADALSVVDTTVGVSSTEIKDPCPCEKTVTIGSCRCGSSFSSTPVSKTTVVANVTLARVNANSVANANSGMNSISGGMGAEIETGDAISTSQVVTVVGSNVTTIK